LCFALLCLAQGISKAVLWFGGARASGMIVYAENTVSSRGAYWHRYQFIASNGNRYDGTAMSPQIALYTKVQVAYLPMFPDINMPAYGSYTAMMGTLWSGTGLLLFGVSRLFRKKSSKNNRISDSA
jgi:hypothetical protein